jgi:serine/threonine-protein kinase
MWHRSGTRTQTTARIAAPEDARAIGGSGPVATRPRRWPGAARWSRACFALLRPTARTPRALSLTVLVTEIAGRPERRALHDAARMLIEHDRVLLPAIRAYHGRRITSRGASVLAAFASPTDAVLCGVAIQELLEIRRATAPRADELSVRLAVHLGETRFRRGQLVGAPVELARTVCGAAAIGQVWLTRSVHLAMNHVEVAVEPLLPVAGGGALEPIPVYRVLRRPIELPEGGRTPSRAAEAGWLGRALESVSEAIASIEEGAAEGRARAVLRVALATAALMLLAAAEILVRAASAGSGLTASLARRRGGGSLRLEGLVRGLEGGLRWIGSRRAIPRAALVRPLW